MVLRLREGVSYNIIEGRTTLLDLRANRYFGLPLETDHSFQRLISGKPLDGADRSRLAALAANRILEAADSRYSPVSAPSYDTPTHSLIDALRVSSGTDSFWRGICLQLTADLELKLVRFDKIVARLQKRKASSTLNQGPQAEGELVTILGPFFKTRRYLTSENQCLRWSIAMVDYLAAFDLAPDLYLGVRTAPFSAHAWVQQGQVVLSDTLDRAKAFTPILKI